MQSRRSVGWAKRRAGLAAVFAAAVMLAVAAGGLAAWRIAESIDGGEGNDERRSRVADHYADALAQALWRYDVVGVRSQLNGLLLHGEIIGARVDGDGGRLAVAVGAAADGGESDGDRRGAARLVVLRRLLAVAEPGGQSIVGVAAFVFSDEAERRRSTIIATGLAAGLAAAAAMGGAGLAAHVVLTAQPLRRLKRIIDESAASPAVAVAAGDDFAMLAAVLQETLAELSRVRSAAAAAAAAATEAGRVKSAFLANVSHELRTPLNGVIGLLTLLLEQPLSPQQHNYVRSALVSAESLLALVNDLLDVTQLEAGKMPLRIAETDVRAMMAEVSMLMSPRAAQRENVLRCDVRGEVPPRLLTDGDKLRRIVVNLVGNAVKFTKCGEVAATLSAARGEGGRLTLRLDVADNGIGIPPEQKERLFQRFVQVDQTATRSYEGSGLGLAICRELCQLMGGRIGVDSTPGLGSLFWVELPVEAAADPAAAQPLPPLRILVVDDIMLNRVLLGEILKIHGHQPFEAEGGQAAVDLLVAGEVCDAVLMDVEMPEMDGCEATRRIRALPPPAADVPVVAVTANIDVEARRRLIEAGVDDWVGKPVGWPEITAAIIRARAAARRRTAARAAD